MNRKASNIRTITFIQAYMGKIKAELIKQGKCVRQIPSEIIMLIEQKLDVSFDLHYGYYQYKWPPWMILELLNGNTASIKSGRFNMCAMDWRIIIKLGHGSRVDNTHAFVQVCLKAVCWDEDEMDYAILRIKSQCVETNDTVIVMERYSKGDDS